jgi:hypothetical protein
MVSDKKISLVEWPPSKMCPVIPTSNQDGRQAKNRKKGDEIKKKSSPRKLLSQSQPSFAEMILGWPPSKIVFSEPDLGPKWPPGRISKYRTKKSYNYGYKCGQLTDTTRLY